MKIFTIAALLISFGLSAQAKDRDPAQAEGPALFGHPVLGMPAPRFTSCRNAAGEAAMHDALTSSHHKVDCKVVKIEEAEQGKEYNVDLNCGAHAGSGEFHSGAIAVSHYTCETKFNKKTGGCKATDCEKD